MARSGSLHGNRRALPRIGDRKRLACNRSAASWDAHCRRRVKHEGERRNMFLRYLGEAATAIARSTRRTTTALRAPARRGQGRRPRPTKFDDRGRLVEDAEQTFGENVPIVAPEESTSSFWLGPNHRTATQTAIATAPHDPTGNSGDGAKDCGRPPRANREARQAAGVASRTGTRIM